MIHLRKKKQGPVERVVGSIPKLVQHPGKAALAVGAAAIAATAASAAASAVREG